MFLPASSFAVLTDKSKDRRSCWLVGWLVRSFVRSLLGPKQVGFSHITKTELRSTCYTPTYGFVKFCPSYDDRREKQSDSSTSRFPACQNFVKLVADS